MRTALYVLLLSAGLLAQTVQATGFVEHLKLPHYVDFQSELGLLRKLQAEFFARDTERDAPMQDAAE